MSGCTRGFASLQAFDFTLEDAVTESKETRLLVGGCQQSKTTDVFGRATDLGRCTDDQPPLACHFFAVPDENGATDFATICQGDGLGSPAA